MLNNAPREKMSAAHDLSKESGTTLARETTEATKWQTKLLAASDSVLGVLCLVQEPVHPEEHSVCMSQCHFAADALQDQSHRALLWAIGCRSPQTSGYPISLCTARSPTRSLHSKQHVCTLEVTVHLRHDETIKDVTSFENSCLSP